MPTDYDHTKKLTITKTHLFRTKTIGTVLVLVCSFLRRSTTIEGSAVSFCRQVLNLTRAMSSVPSILQVLYVKYFLLLKKAPKH